MTSSVESLAATLSALTFHELPAATRHSALRCILDAIGCAAAGSRHSSIGGALRWMDQNFAPGSVTVWFTGKRSSPLGAAFVNSLSASVLDLDDGHRLATGHPGAAVIPAALAVAQSRGSTLQETLLAIVCGYQAGVGTARMRDPSKQRSVATGRWSAVAVAAAVGKLRGLPAGELAHAIALAETLAPNAQAADHAGFAGSDAKEGIPWSVLTGMAAVDQAALGWQGYLQALDNPDVYRTGAPTMSGNGGFFIDTTYFKPYACCRWIHSAIDAVLDLKRGGLAPSAVVSIEIGTFQRALSLGNQVRPEDLIAAQFSIPFTVAVAMVAGADALAPMSADLLRRSDVIRMAERVTLVLNPELDASFPAQVPARVKVTTGDTIREREVRHPLGDPLNPLTDFQLIEKAVRLCADARTAEQVCELAARLFAPDYAAPTVETPGKIFAFMG